MQLLRISLTDSSWSGYNSQSVSQAELPQRQLHIKLLTGNLQTTTFVLEKKWSFSWCPHFILPTFANKEVGKGEPCVLVDIFTPGLPHAAGGSAPRCARNFCITLRMRLVSSLDATDASLACPVMLLPPPPPCWSLDGSMCVVHSHLLLAAGLFLEVDWAVSLKVG